MLLLVFRFSVTVGDRVCVCVIVIVIVVVSVIVSARVCNRVL